MRRMIGFVAVLLLIISPYASAAQSSPELVVSAPTEGATITGTDVAVTFQIAGLNLVPSGVPLTEAGKRPDANRPGEGHLHFMLDLLPIVVWEHAEPYTFNNITPGEHQLMVELVNNDHSPLSPPVVKQIRFRTAVMMPETSAQSERATALWLALIGVLFGAGLLLRFRFRPLGAFSSRR
ncbi:MAG TPA: hypothetical protein VGD69_06690 [Herpetosiphonaceae bacterium]